MPLPADLLRRPIAHRALHDRSAGRPENSPAAIRAAVEAGYAIEIDVQGTSDGQAVVFHDEWMERLTEATGFVKDYTAADLGRITLRHSTDTIPTLPQVLAIVAGLATLTGCNTIEGIGKDVKKAGDTIEVFPPQGRFVLPHCDDCGRTHWYPRAVCPHCFSTKLSWKPASGRGTVYSHSTMLRVEAPYTLAYVTLEEGPTMMTNLVGGLEGGLEGGGTYAIGQRVRVVFTPSDGGPAVPMFTPV